MIYHPQFSIIDIYLDLVINLRLLLHACACQSLVCIVFSTCYGMITPYRLLGLWGAKIREQYLSPAHGGGPTALYQLW